MSQAVASPPPAAAPGATSAPMSTRPVNAKGVQAEAQTGSAVPARLRVLRLVAALACLIVAALTAFQLLLGWQATRQAASDTEQLIRSQTIKTDLLHADALATNAFLVGGLEPAEQRAAYDQAIAAVTAEIADAAQAQPADRAVLEALNTQVVQYAERMELARANNRQGFPVGAAYLSQASSELRATALPLVDALVKANAGRAETTMGRLYPIFVILPVALALALLWLVNLFIAQRFKRRVNVGLAVAAALIAASGVAATVAVQGQVSENAALRNGSYADVVGGAAARSAANDAKANESLRLIARGSGKAYEEKWTAAAKVVTDNFTHVGTGIGDEWTSYAAAHDKLKSLDDGGQWDEAVGVATNDAADGATKTFTTFDSALAADVERSGSSTTSQLRGGTLVLLILAGSAALAGLVAAASAWRGVSRRLEEYA